MSKQDSSLILTKLKSTENKVIKEALLTLHQQVFHTVRNFVLKANGTTEDAEDIFQDGLFIILKLTKQDKLPIDLNIEAYLFTICKNKWLKTMAKEQQKVPLFENNIKQTNDKNQIEQMIDKEQEQILNDILHQLGTECRKVLLYYYYEKKKMRSIAELMNYASEQVAKNKKSKCMKKLRAIVLSSKSNKQWLLDQ